MGLPFTIKVKSGSLSLLEPFPRARPPHHISQLNLHKQVTELGAGITTSVFVSTHYCTGQVGMHYLDFQGCLHHENMQRR